MNRRRFLQALAVAPVVAAVPAVASVAQTVAPWTGPAIFFRNRVFTAQGTHVAYSAVLSPDEWEIASNRMAAQLADNMALTKAMIRHGAIKEAA